METKTGKKRGERAKPSLPFLTGGERGERAKPYSTFPYGRGAGRRGAKTSF